MEQYEIEPMASSYILLEINCKYMKLNVLLLVVVSILSCGSGKSPIPPREMEKNLPKFYIYGVGGDVTTQVLSGIVLAGGSTDNDDAMRWFLKRANGGDIVVLRSSGSDGYNKYFYSDLGVDVNTVTSVVITSREQANTDSLDRVIRRAEALFIAGGDQSNYMSYWKGTKVETAIKYLLEDKKITIGGTSAGMAVLSEFCYTGKNGSATAAQALFNPYHTNITIEPSFINLPLLKGVITDTHYKERDRQGRHFVFMARMVQDMSVQDAKGIACDEKTAVCVDENGVAHVFGPQAYFLRASIGSPELCREGQPLTWNLSGTAIAVDVVPGDTTGSNSFDLRNWQVTVGSNVQHEWWSVTEGVLKRVTRP